MTSRPTPLPMTREVTLVRSFDAPRALVWVAWTNPKHVVQWWAPRHFTNPVYEMDVRPGGKLLIHMKAPDGTVFPMPGVFTEVVKHERLRFTAYADGTDGTRYLESDTIVTFEEEGGRTRLTIKAKAKGSHPAAPQMLDGMQEGWSQSLDKLGELVVEMADNLHVRLTMFSHTGEGSAANGAFHAAQFPASTTWTGSMISSGIVSPRRCRTAASVAISLIVMALKSAVASIRPAAIAATASGMALTPVTSGPLPGFASSASSTPSAMTSLAHSTASTRGHWPLALRKTPRAILR